MKLSGFRLDGAVMAALVALSFALVACSSEKEPPPSDTRGGTAGW